MQGQEQKIVRFSYQNILIILYAPHIFAFSLVKHSNSNKRYFNSFGLFWDTLYHTQMVPDFLGFAHFKVWCSVRFWALFYRYLAPTICLDF
jgi:hypothetical protein